MNEFLQFPIKNELFGPLHISIMAACVFLTIGLTIFACKKLSMEKFLRILLIVGLISESVKAITYCLNNEGVYGGYLSKDNLPLHLCSVQIILIIILNFSKNEKFKRLIRSFMVPTTLIGGIGAVIFATWSSLNLWPVTIVYFVYHCFLTAFSIYLLTRKSEEEKLTFKDFYQGLLMFYGMMILAIYVNSILYERYVSIDELGNVVEKFEGVNFMYVINPPGGLEFAKQWGWGIYFLIYVGTWLLGFTLIYIKPIIEYIKERKANKALQSNK